MKVTEYLKRFLTEQPAMEAAVPGLGVFYAGQRGGKACILFKEVTPNDKAFLNFIAFEENITEEEVRQGMESWVRELLQELKGAGMVNVEGVGTFVIEQDRVNFNPFVAQESENDAHFGLEGPSAPTTTVAPSVPSVEPVRPAPAEAQPERLVLPPISRPQRPARPNIEKPKPRAVPNPGGSGKTIALGGSGNRPTRPQPRPVRPERGEAEPFYTRWWFIALCAIAVLLVLMFSVTPIRRDVLGIGAEPVAVQMGLPAMDEMDLEENVDEMIYGEEMTSATESEMNKNAAENKAVEQQIIAGEKERKEAEKAAKASPKPLASTKPAAKPVEKPAEKPAAQPARPKTKTTESEIAAVKPQPGRFYIIVGGFRDQSNAFGQAEKLRESGLNATVLYNEVKTIYYVSVKTCATREEAMAARTDIRDNKKMECWIFTK
ncbi:hypothetical protein HDR62_06770 [bacterium]|nr:hypothetical protein [bacterium]